jgi:hypothetical protein
LCAAALAALAAPGVARAADAGVMHLEASDEPTLLVPGGPDGSPARFAARIGPALGDALGSLQLRTVGTADGVTAANRFDASVLPDGLTALLLPGSAALLWAAGDPRVHFDPSHWIPVLAGCVPGVVVARGGAEALRPGETIRVAVPERVSPALAGWLGLDLLGVTAQPVWTGEERRASRADALYVRGEEAAARLPRLAADGLHPAFLVGPPQAGGSAAPALGDLLALHGRRPDPALLRGWETLATASALEAMLVLPRLSPARAVARWREASWTVQPAPGLTRGQGAAALIRPLAAEPEAQLALRRWIAGRVEARPG